jgi:phosphatidate cytidylyltransferase
MTPATPTPSAKSRSDLGIRTLSAIVMVAVAGTALWLGGWVFTAFIIAVGLGVIWEYWELASRIVKTPFAAALWMVAGVSYVGVAMAAVYRTRVINDDIWWTAALLGVVIAIDVFAYGFGRTIGGPKIAPAISPNKTWAGLLGGIVGATLFLTLWLALWPRGDGIDKSVLLHGVQAMAVLPLAIASAVIAQAGDFFESWMKRRAGMKDSGSLIPGHGGLFDRIDGTLAILFAYSLLLLWRGL